MKVVHTVNYAPGFSGMYNTVRDLVIEERRRGLEADVVDSADSPIKPGADGILPVPVSHGDKADIICWHHAIAENWLNESHRNIIIFLHGTPEFNFFSELYEGDKVFSLLVGAANMKVPRVFVSMWKRHIPYWESFLKMPVHYVPAWTNLSEWSVSQRPVDPDVIRIGLLDFWRLTREPFSLIAALERLRRRTRKKVLVNVWGLTEWPNDTFKSILQWMVEDDVMVLRGNTQKPMEDVYHQNDMILSMSTEETRVVREAYACGVPVVCGRGPLDFTKYAADGINSDALVDAIEQCHADLVSDTPKVRGYLRDYAEKNFDVRKSVEALSCIFDEVVKEHGSVNQPRFIGKVRPVASIKDTCDHIVQGLAQGKPTCYLRFGDGDILLMAGEERESFHKNSPELQQELIEAFQHKEAGYLVASSAGMVNEGRMRKGLFGAFDYNTQLYDVVNRMRPDETLENAIALAYQSVFDPEWFLELLKRHVHGKKVLFIGGEELCKSPLVRRAFDVSTFISLPMADAYYAMNDQMEDIKSKAQEHNLIICAAGMATRVLAKRLWKQGIRVNFIDIGSIADGLAGIQDTRTWLRMVGDKYRKPYELALLPRKSDIVVLSYKNEEKTIRCFEALAKHTENYRVIWVDNGSGRESINKVKPAAAMLEECDLVTVPHNEGFSKGVNHALRKIFTERSADYTVLLNNDVIVTPKWLGGLISAQVSNGLDAVGPLTSENNPHSLDALRDVVANLPQFTHETAGERASMLGAQFGNKVMVAGNMLSFFCCLLTRETFEQVGFLDENLFCYGEDNDFFERCARLGRKFGLALGVYVHHDHGSTSDMMGTGWQEEQRVKALKYLGKKWPKPRQMVDVGEKRA